MKILKLLICAWLCVLMSNLNLYCECNMARRRAIHFQTDFISDPDISTFRENYITLKISERVAQDSQSLAICFRVRFTSITQQCLFKQNIAFKFVADNFGFVKIDKVVDMIYQLKENVMPLKWYHICLSYEKHHVVMMVNNEKAIDYYTEPETHRNITLQPYLKLGYCPWHDPLVSITRGFLTDFNIWSKALSTTEMETFTKKCGNPHSKPDLFDWNGGEIAEKGNSAEWKNLSNSDVCQDDERPVILILANRQTYGKAKLMCALLGGVFPLPQNETELQTLESQFVKDNRYDDNGKDIAGVCQKFWMPVTQGALNSKGKGYGWLEDQNAPKREAGFLPWKRSEPNGLNVERCVVLIWSTKEYQDIGCSDVYCSLCKFEKRIDFTLHGLPEKSTIHTRYFLVPQNQKSNHLTFAGHKRSQIAWDYDSRQWQILDMSQNNPLLGFHAISSQHVIVGKYPWKILEEWKTFNGTNWIHHAEYQTRELKLSKVQKVECTECFTKCRKKSTSQPNILMTYFLNIYFSVM